MVNLPEPQSVTFSSLMSDIESGAIKIPQFQRDFVWSKDKSAKLLDSIVKGYPIGTFILWKTKEELRVVRNIGNLDLRPTPKGDFVQYVIDGQQRLTTLFASLKGLEISREDHIDDFSQFYVDLEADDESDVILMGDLESESHRTIRLHDLLYGKLRELAKYPENLQDKIQNIKERIHAYQFAAVLVRDAPIDVATEIFTRLNVGGKPLSVFEIMVAKTFDVGRNFDLAEKYEELRSDLEGVDYGTVPESVVLQAVAILLVKECRKKDILKLSKHKVIDLWPAVTDAIKEAVEYFRNTYRIPASALLPYPNLIVPFTYFFHKRSRKPSARQAELLEDFFWRAAIGGRYSQGVENRLAQDCKKLEKIIAEKVPKYEWAVDTSGKFVEENGWFSLGRSYIKALLCILAHHEPKSFADNGQVRISNDWLKQANSKNYHHFFPKSFLRRSGEDEFYINHIANITIVDDYLNKREIGSQPPSKYLAKFGKDNKKLDQCMKTHLIDLRKSGALEDDYDKFFKQRCAAYSKELKARILPQAVDSKQSAAVAEDTELPEME